MKTAFLSWTKNSLWNYECCDEIALMGTFRCRNVVGFAREEQIFSVFRHRNIAEFAREEQIFSAGRIHTGFFLTSWSVWLPIHRVPHSNCSVHTMAWMLGRMIGWSWNTHQDPQILKNITPLCIRSCPFAFVTPRHSSSIKTQKENVFRCCCRLLLVDEAGDFVVAD